MPRAEPCGSCGAPILWFASASTGRPMPFDAKPVGRHWILRAPAGNAELRLHASAIRATPGFKVAASQSSYRPHFATCPYADRWRGRRRR